MAKKTISNTFTVNTMDDPISAFVVDLENEMTNVALDENGDLIADFDMYFKVRAYYGTTNVLSDSACTVSASCSDPDVTITDTNAKTMGIRVQISSGTHILDTTEVSVTVTHTTYGTRTVIFTLAGVCSGENAVLQELLPSLDAISFARTAAGGLTPSLRGLYLYIKKTQGGSTSTQSIGDSDLTIRWSSSSMPVSKNAGNGWGNGTSTGISWNDITMQIANTVAATNIYIAAFNSAGTLVDRETIPVIKDGANGDDGVSYSIVFTKSAARVDENHIVTAELAGYAYKNVGGVSSALANTTIRYGYILNDSDTYFEDTTNDSGFFDAGTWFNGDDITDYGKNSPSIFAAIDIEGTVVHSEMITISVKGSTGNRGKVGRFFYYAGAWDDFASTDSFLVNDAQAPYFYYNNNYWVFNPETNGTYTKQNMGTPSSSSPNWELMTNDFKYLITEAIFGSYAHFGSAIINGDWMLSQHGTRNGVASTEYTKFDPNYPNTDHAYQDQSHNFIPNYCVDLLTGETYQNRAFVRGTVYADSGYFNGSLRTTFHDISNESGWVYYSSSDIIPSGMGVGWNYLVGDYDNMCMLAKKTTPSGGTANNLHVRLPNTLSMIGRRIILYEMNQPPFSNGVSSFEIRQLNQAAFVGVSAYGHAQIDFQAVYGISICSGVVEILAVPHPTDATICTWAIINVGGCLWDYATK